MQIEFSAIKEINEPLNDKEIKCLKLFIKLCIQGTT